MLNYAQKCKFTHAQSPCMENARARAIKIQRSLPVLSQTYRRASTSPTHFAEIAYKMSTWGTWAGGWGDDQDEDENNEFDPSKVCDRQYNTCVEASHTLFKLHTHTHTSDTPLPRTLLSCSLTPPKECLAEVVMEKYLLNSVSRYII